MINRIVDLVVKDIRKQCASYRVCSNKCPYAIFCEDYYSYEFIDTVDDDDVAETVKKCIKEDIKRIMMDIIKEV